MHPKIMLQICQQLSLFMVERTAFGVYKRPKVIGIIFNGIFRIYNKTYISLLFF